MLQTFITIFIQHTDPLTLLESTVKELENNKTETEKCTEKKKREEL